MIRCSKTSTFSTSCGSFGSDMRTCEWVVHRIWLSTKAVMQRLQEKTWNTESALLLDEEKIRSLGPTGKHYEEIWQDRMMASGFTSANFNTRGEQPHELLEWHDGNNVYSVLDRKVLVQQGETPVGTCRSRFTVPPLWRSKWSASATWSRWEHLQRELDTLRSQRRDGATIALNAGWVFDDAAVDEDDLTFGPAAAIRADELMSAGRDHADPGEGRAGVGVSGGVGDPVRHGPCVRYQRRPGQLGWWNVEYGDGGAAFPRPRWAEGSSCPHAGLRLKWSGTSQGVSLRWTRG